MDDAIYDKATGLLINYPTKKPRREISVELSLEAERDIRLKIYATESIICPGGCAEITMYGRPFAAMLVGNQVTMFALDGELPHIITLI